MDAVKAFTYELYSIMDMKPPISKAKMTAITRNAIKAIKLYKHVVQCVEKFIQKCKPEYKIPGLYVIDSIVRQSRHQFGNEKDVFAPRFARNLRTTFTHLFACPEEDKSKVIRVLNLWQKNAVFTTEIIQPIFDLAANPDYEQTSILSTMDSPKLSVKTDLFRSQENTPVKDDTSKSFDALQSQNLENENKQPLDPAIIEHIQAIQSLLKKQPGQTSTSPQVKKSDGTKLFDKKILDYDYGDDEEEMLNQSPEFQQQPQQNALDGIDSLLNNPEVLRTLRNVEGLISTQSKQQAELDKIKEMRKEAEFDKHLAQTVQNLPFASECELKPAPIQSGGMVSIPYSNQLFNTQVYQQQQQSMMAIDVHHNKPSQIITYDDPNQSKPEVIDLDHIASPPPTKRDSRRDGYSSSSTRKRSPMKSSRERQREREKERERDRERRKKYLPPFKKNHVAVVSTTLWVGHLSKLIHQDDLYGLFQPIGDIVSLNLISPRGCAFLCMNRRQDAARIMSKYQGERLQGKPMTIAWAPGQAMKDKEWKDYWEIDDGVSYIPWEKLNKDIDYDELEVGGMLDEDTMPEWLKTHLKNLRTSKKIEKKEEEKLTEGNQQSLTTSNVFDPQGVQSPSVQMQMSPAQNSQPNQMNFNMPQTMGMPNPFGINHRLINPMMNPMMPGTMTPMSMGHPSMMMMNRMPSPFGPPPNMTMMGNPQQMAMPNDAQKSLGVPPDMMMSFPFGMNLPPQAAAISSAQTMMGMNPPTVTTGTSSAPTLLQNANQKDLSTTNPPNQQLDPSKIMQFNLPPPTLSTNLSDFTQNASNTNMGNDKYDPSLLGNSDHDESKDMDRNNERDDRNRGRDNRNRNRDNRERNDRLKDRDNKMDRGRRDDLSQRQDPRNRVRTEQRERKSSRWGDKVNEEEVDNQKNINCLSVKDDLGMAQAPNLVQMDNVKDLLMQNNSIHQILDVIQDNMGNPPFQPGMFGPNGPPPNQMFNMPPQGFPQDGPRPPHMDNGNMRGRGGWNRGGRGGFRGRGGYNNGPNWDNNGPNWDNNSGPNWDNNGPPPVWQNQSMNRGGMMGGRGNLRPPLMQNVMGRGRDNWIDNNSSGGRGRDSDNWGGHGGVRDLDNKWGGRGGSRDSDGWGGRGNRSSPWRGNGNRRRNDDWDGPNQKRWRRDDNTEWDDQQKPWKQRGPVNEDEEWQNNKQGSSWVASKKDEGNYSKYKSRDNNEERPRKPSKWGDKESDDKVKEDRWNRKSVERTLSKDKTTTEEGPHQTSAPMDLDIYEGESVGNIEQVHGAQELVTTNSNKQFIERISVRKEYRETALNHDVDTTSNYNVETCDKGEENIKQNVDEQHNDELNKFGDYQHDFSNNSIELPHGNIEEVQQNSENQPLEKFELQNVEEKLHDAYNDVHNDYQNDSRNDFNTRCEYETNQNDGEFEQNQQSEYNDGVHDENQRSDYNQPFDNEPSFKYNNQEQQECSVNNFVSQAEETNEERYTEDKSQESQENFYFGMNSGSCINKSVELEQQNSEILPIEGSGIAPSDHNEVSEINTAELNQS